MGHGQGSYSRRRPGGGVQLALTWALLLASWG